MKPETKQSLALGLIIFGAFGMGVWIAYTFITIEVLFKFIEAVDKVFA